MRPNIFDHRRGVPIAASAILLIASVALLKYVGTCFGNAAGGPGP